MVNKVTHAADRVFSADVAAAMEQVKDVMGTLTVTMDDGTLTATFSVHRDSYHGLGPFNLADALMRVVDRGQARRLAELYGLDVERLVVMAQDADADQPDRQ